MWKLLKISIVSVDLFQSLLFNVEGEKGLTFLSTFRSIQIIVCSNHMNIQDEVNQVVIHELIHAYDQCRSANLDWSNCVHHACAEVCVLVIVGISFSNI